MKIQKEPVKYTQRETVWLAFADLFLDTDVSIFYDYIARICAESPFSLQELKYILEREVAPVCAHNLMVSAGVWDGFDEQWLIKSISNKLKRNKVLKLLSKIFVNTFFKDIINDYWQHLEPSIIERRKSM